MSVGGAQVPPSDLAGAEGKEGSLCKLLSALPEGVLVGTGDIS